MTEEEATELIADASMYPTELFRESYADTIKASRESCRRKGIKVSEKKWWSFSPNTSTAYPRRIRFRRGFSKAGKLYQAEAFIHEITHINAADGDLGWWPEYVLKAWMQVVGEARARGAEIAFRLYVRPALADVWAPAEMRAIGPHLRTEYPITRRLPSASMDAAIVNGLTRALKLSPDRREAIT